MEYVNLGTEYKLLAFSDYREFRRVRQLCEEKGKVVVFAGDLTRPREVHFRQWAFESRNGWVDYTYGKEAYIYKGTPGSVPPALPTARESFMSAVNKIDRQAAYIIVCR